MKKHIDIFIGITLLITIVMTACSEDTSLFDLPNDEFHKAKNASISEEGYLLFPSYSSLKLYIEAVQNGETPDITPFSRSGKNFE